MKRFKRIWSDGKRSRSRKKAWGDCGLGVQHDAIPLKDTQSFFRFGNQGIGELCCQ